ncbi:MAG: Trimethylamine methyltransferase, partial [Candidatus Hydrogenedentes bacterium]|nr:Trimethylamine methyltransferase [Candidatus Hydrogenedentota bacterium]
MTTILNPYPRFLDDATLDRMHGAALTMLSRTGVRVEHDEVRAEIARRDGFTLRDGRVHIEPAAVERWVETRRAEWTGVPQPVPARGYQMLFDDRPAWVVDR